MSHLTRSRTSVANANGSGNGSGNDNISGAGASGGGGSGIASPGSSEVGGAVGSFPVMEGDDEEEDAAENAGGSGSRRESAMSMVCVCVWSVVKLLMIVVVQAAREDVVCIWVPFLRCWLFVFEVYTCLSTAPSILRCLPVCLVDCFVGYRGRPCLSICPCARPYGLAVF